MQIDSNELKKFILEASRATYASGDESIKDKQPDESTTIRYESGAYRFHDNYFGGEPYGGREVVSFDNKPIWMMVYYGLVHENNKIEDVYPFLMESLSNATQEMPYRGPESYENDSFRYENKFTGTMEHFSGTEKIYKDDTCVYEASYIGGLVDR
ncbi:DUF5680 domain-containing protein [candidate division KSB1 bacterium]